MSDVKKDERVLLVVSNLETHGDPDFRRLYDWLEKYAVEVAETMMKPFYRKVVPLSETNVTYERFLRYLETLANEPETKALDVFLHLHGAEDTLYFQENEGISIAQIEADIKALGLRDRLRLLYSTACYGAAHAPCFVRAGFRVASGAVKINANSIYDYPWQMTAWAAGSTYKHCVKQGNNEAMRALWDGVAGKFLNMDDIDSHKEISGRSYTRITTPAD